VLHLFHKLTIFFWIFICIDINILNLGLQQGHIYHKGQNAHEKHTLKHTLTEITTFIQLLTKYRA